MPEFAGVFEVAFPRAMQIYWLLIALKNKIMKVKKDERL